MTELNNKEFIIKKIGIDCIEIGDTSSFSHYKSGGVIQQILKPQKIDFISLEESLSAPLQGSMKTFFELKEDGRSEILHLGLNSVLDFYASNNRLPYIHDEFEAESLFQIARNHFFDWQNLKKNGKGGVPEIPKLNQVLDLIRNVSLYAKTQISPSCTFWGGIIAQEVIKFLGIFTPIHQWLHFDTFEALPEEISQVNLKGTRYDNQIAIFGENIQIKLQKLKIFLVGAGALGCELVKTFALMGVSSDKEGEIRVTDDDTIELSNLSRQLLFRLFFQKLKINSIL